MFFPRRPPPPPPPPARDDGYVMSDRPHLSFRVLVLKTLLHIDQKLTQLESKIMASFDDLKAAQDATDSIIAKVKTDVETLTAMIAAIPPAGMTAEQQAALDAAAAKASAINDSLSAVDAMTADPAPPAPPVEPTA